MEGGVVGGGDEEEEKKMARISAQEAQHRKGAFGLGHYTVLRIVCRPFSSSFYRHGGLVVMASAS